MIRVSRMIYENGWVKVVLCLDEDQCYTAEYTVLEKKEFEERLARLIGEMNADAIISYEKGELPEEP
ncbi:MAG: hypothetical protein DRO40_10160 [Thermoprotei archaeon]|nr:MAG: hypothetical protein DRO40_10160 [Thermoprotei archaeon]